MNNLDTGSVILVWLLMATAVFWNLGGYDLASPDEPRYGLVAQEMLDNDHWLLLHRNERPYPDKPPLFFWSIATLSVLNGGQVNAWTARLPSALAAMGVLALIAYWAGGGHWRKPIAVLAPLLLVTSFRFFFQAHMAQIDMLLCFFVTAALVLGFEAMTTNRARPALMGWCMGLGILAKGPVAVLIPMGALLVFAAFSGRGTLRRYPVRAFTWALLPVGLWLAALTAEAWRQDAWDYMANILFDQTVKRYATPWHHYKPFYYYFTVLVYDFFPWLPLLLTAIPWRKASRQGLSPHHRFAWAVIVWVLFFFSLSKGKRNLYIVPLYPFAAWLVASATLHYHRMIAPVWRRLVWSAAPAVLLFVGAALIALATGKVPLDDDLALPAGMPIFSLWAAGMWVALCALTAIGLLVRSRTSGFAVTVMAAMLCLNLLYHGPISNWLDPMLSARRFMQQAETIIANEPEPRSPVAMVDYRSPFRFYGQTPLVELATESLNGQNPKLFGIPDLVTYWQEHPRGWAIVRESDWQEYTAAHPQLQADIFVAMPVGSDHYRLMRPPPPTAAPGDDDQKTP